MYGGGSGGVYLVFYVLGKEKEGKEKRPREEKNETNGNREKETQRERTAQSETRSEYIYIYVCLFFPNMFCNIFPVYRRHSPCLHFYLFSLHFYVSVCVRARVCVCIFISFTLLSCDDPCVCHKKLSLHFYLVPVLCKSREKSSAIYTVSHL